MGGGSENPIVIKDEENDMTHFEPPSLGALNLQDNKQAITIDSSDSEPLQENPQPVQKVGKEKRTLMRELKALGYKPVGRPDYTKPLDEPSWGDEDDEEDDDFDADAMSEEDDEDEIYEYQDMDEEKEFLKHEYEEDSDVDMKM